MACRTQFSAVTALDGYTGNGIMVTDRTTLVIWPAAHSSVRTLNRHCSISTFRVFLLQLKFNFTANNNSSNILIIYFTVKKHNDK